MKVRIDSGEIDIEGMVREINNERNGAIVTFLGTVRNENNGKKVKKIVYDAYLPMAVYEMERICDEAYHKFNLIDLSVHHRIGEFFPGDYVVFIAVSSAHRDEAFQACRFIIDGIKESVPIWKKEFYEDGSEWILPP
ncbi:MAG: molybdenum cofactor biosynthesis protein MoaE [Thermoplasmata archaeon]|jgi:molybdopterin synthase catalytic subunit|nr:molybdenum cofactor biosynthesis protein MoaE [Thermoplasmatales archaeon]PMP74457.1 MAG: molybdenum cofactor biosynthesis protein MoaE [Aciduliprofundum sp.]HEU12503.1 molybdenum cofactor biosynthesis protein MoaE [Euryarchaeota archaeon]